MAIIRNYVYARSPLLAPQLLIVALHPWQQVAIRGIDASGRDLPAPLFVPQRGGGMLRWREDCVYELVFSDDPDPLGARDLLQLLPAGQPVVPVRDRSLTCSPSARDIAKFEENPPPPPPPGAAPSAPFQLRNVFRLYP